MWPITVLSSQFLPRPAPTITSAPREAPTSCLPELVDHVIGIEPDKDWITAAIIEAETTRFIESARFSADRDGYTNAVSRADAHTTPGERVWAIEG